MCVKYLGHVMRNKYMNSNHSIEYEKFYYSRKNAEGRYITRVVMLLLNKNNNNNNSKPIARNKNENRDMT